MTDFRVYIFDLDFTIWNAGDTFCSETCPPYKWKNGKLVDAEDRWIRLYPDVKEILEKLKEQGVIIAAASRTHEPNWANDLLQLFDIDRYFTIKEIYAGEKSTHILNIMQKTNCSVNELIFFDDEQRNIDTVQALGITTVHIKDGLNLCTKHIQPFFML